MAGLLPVRVKVGIGLGLGNSDMSLRETHEQQHERETDTVKRIDDFGTPWAFTTYWTVCDYSDHGYMMEKQGATRVAIERHQSI